MEYKEREYQNFVQKLAKPGEDILAQLTPDNAYLIHMAMGVAGEAGELLDAIKKHTIYKKPLDFTNLIEELGDIEFFLQGIRNHFDLTRDDVISVNVNKLSKRYPGITYSNEAANNRADKA